MPDVAHDFLIKMEMPFVDYPEKNEESQFIMNCLLMFNAIETTCSPESVARQITDTKLLETMDRIWLKNL